MELDHKLNSPVDVRWAVRLVGEEFLEKGVFKFRAEESGVMDGDGVMEQNKVLHNLLVDDLLDSFTQLTFVRAVWQSCSAIGKG